MCMAPCGNGAQHSDRVCSHKENAFCTTENTVEAGHNRSGFTRFRPGLADGRWLMISANDPDGRWALATCGEQKLRWVAVGDSVA